MRYKMFARRKDLGWTQEEVAKRAGLSRGQYSHIERGRSEPNIRQIKAIALALGVPDSASFFDQKCDEMEHEHNNTA